MNNAKGNAKYAFDMAKYGAAKVFKYEQYGDFPLRWIVAPVVFGAAIGMGIQIDDPETFTFDKQNVTQSEQQSITNAVDKLRALQSDHQNVAYQAYLRNFNTPALQKQLKRAEYDYIDGAEDSTAFILTDPQIGESAFAAYQQIYKQSGFPYSKDLAALHPQALNECRLKFQDNENGLEARADGISQCMAEPENHRSDSVMVFTGMGFMMGWLLLGAGLITGVNIRPGDKPQRKNYIKPKFGEN